MSPYKSKGKRSQWTEENLQRALAAIDNGKSKNSVSKKFKISRRTLHRYINKRTNKKERLGRKTVLTQTQETELSSRVIRLAEVGYPITKRMLRRSVFNYCEQNCIPNNFSKEKHLAARFWLKAFLSRHPEISVRRAQSMNPARAQKLNKFIVTDYFEKLKKVLLELDLMDKPERIFNVDEKGCRLTLHHQQSVLALKGTKRVHLVAPEHAENVTVVSCGNTSGVRIPSAILFKGQRLKPEWCDNLPSGTLTLMTTKASMTVDTFNQWIKHLARYKLPGKCLLIFDGASCHLDTSIVEAADAYDITLFCLPSNTTHELQPMDKSVFKLFKYHWDEQVLLYWARYKDRNITKQRFGEIFSVVWNKAVTPENIISGFSATGIYPFNPQVIPEVAFAPSILTEKQNLEENFFGGNRLQETQRESSPQPGTSGSQKRKYTENTSVPKLTNTSNILKKKLNSKRTLLSSSDDSDADISLYSDTLSETFSSEEERRAEINEDKVKRSSGANIGKEKAKIASKEQETLKDEQQTQMNTVKGRQNKKVCEKEEKEQPQEETNQVEEKKAEEELNITFTEMLETPYKDTIKKTKRRKAINSKALVVKRDVFQTKKDNQAKQSNLKNGTKLKQTQNKDSWYCKLCLEDLQMDMRLCSKCLDYVHEECVGLTKSDKTIFICPDCS